MTVKIKKERCRNVEGLSSTMVVVLDDYCILAEIKGRESTYSKRAFVFEMCIRRCHAKTYTFGDPIFAQISKI